MKQETQEKYNRVRARIKNGESITSACTAEHLGVSNYYFITKGTGKKTYKTKTKKKPAYVDVPLQTTSSDKVTVIVCQTHQLKTLLEGLT